MRSEFSVIFVAIIFALAACSVMAYRSRKSIGLSVSLMLLALIPPVMGNLIIIISGDRLISNIGSYIYYIGMDMIMFALLHFTFRYCSLKWPNRWLKYFVNLMLAIDALQLLCNPFFGHAFTTEKIMVDGFPYYRLIPLAGQIFHRVVDYSIFIAIIIIFLVKSIRSPRIYSERYYVILLSMEIGGVWQTAYIFSGTPVDRSMIGFGIFGLLISFFSLYYRPMRLLDRMLANIASEMPEALFFFDAGGRCLWANNPAISLVGLKNEELDSATERLIAKFGECDRKNCDVPARRIIGSGEAARYYVLEKRMVTDDKGHPAGSLLSVRDNTEEHLRLQREIYNATHDGLTGLFTREYLYERIRELLSANTDEKYYIVFVDVKNFKLVNDVFSTAFGDYALCCIADWLRANVPETCVYGRLAGDTFGVCLPVCDFDAERLDKTLSQFNISDGTVEYQLLMHLGVYEVADNDKDVSVMFDRAHFALSMITEEYQTHIAYYDNKLREKILADQRLSSQLNQAIAEGQICPYLQPIVDAEGTVVGAEVLVRWIHPSEGFLSPGTFIPVFEKNGMIVELDRHMWRCACEILSRWGDKNNMFISVNISPKDFFFMDVFSEITGLIRKYGISPERLRIEITETVMMNDADERMKTLSDFREAGFIVEMDDFGSGYSSLNLLKDMPVDVLKIDMKFLSRSKDDRKAMTIVRNILNLSSDLGIASLTEGIENEAQFRILAEMGCKLFQGYLFAKPLPVEEFERFIENNTTENV